MEKEIKEKKERKVSAWNLHVAEVRKQNPRKKAGEIFKIAKESYKK
jgi:hypothetical protein